MLNLNIAWLIVFALKISAVFVDMLYCTVCISDFNIPLETRKEQYWCFICLSDIFHLSPGNFLKSVPN